MSCHIQKHAYLECLATHTDTHTHNITYTGMMCGVDWVLQCCWRCASSAPTPHPHDMTSCAVACRRGRKAKPERHSLSRYGHLGFVAVDVRVLWMGPARVYRVSVSWLPLAGSWRSSG